MKTVAIAAIALVVLLILLQERPSPPASAAVNAAPVAKAAPAPTKTQAPKPRPAPAKQVAVAPLELKRIPPEAFVKGEEARAELIPVSTAAAAPAPAPGPDSVFSWGAWAAAPGFPSAGGASASDAVARAQGAIATPGPRQTVSAATNTPAAPSVFALPPSLPPTAIAPPVSLDVKNGHGWGDRNHEHRHRHHSRTPPPGRGG